MWALFPCSSNWLNGINWILFLLFGILTDVGFASAGK